MRVKYEMTIFGVCPVDGAVDSYVATIESAQMIRVEDIFAFTRGLAPSFQEELTQRVADEFKASVVTVGSHSGVKTRCWV